MAEVIHATPNKMTKARNTQGDGEEGIEDIYDSIESLKDQHQDHVGTEESSKSLGTVRSQQPDPVSPPRCPIRAVVVLLVLLSVVLLVRLLERFAVQHKNESMDKDVEQHPQWLENVTEQHTTVSMDRDLEQPLTPLVTEQRDSLLCQQDCPSGWYKFGCKCYQITREWGSWKKIRESCITHGADLVVVDSKEETDFISRNGWNVWLGATDEASEGLWRWVDGTVLSADNPSWGRGKPDGGKDKNCMRTFREETNSKWTDVSCGAGNYGLCEYNLMK